MNIDDLVRMCQNSIDHKLMPQSRAQISLKMPENKRCPKQRRLFGRIGPLGDVVSYGFDNMDVVIFDAVEVLAYITVLKELAKGPTTTKDDPNPSAENDEK